MIGPLAPILKTQAHILRLAVGYLEVPLRLAGAISRRVVGGLRLVVAASLHD